MRSSLSDHLSRGRIHNLDKSIPIPTILQRLIHPTFFPDTHQIPQDMGITTRLNLLSGSRDHSLFPDYTRQIDGDSVGSGIGAIELITLSREIARVGECTE